MFKVGIDFDHLTFEGPKEIYHSESYTFDTKSQLPQSIYYNTQVLNKKKTQQKPYTQTVKKTPNKPSKTEPTKLLSPRVKVKLSKNTSYHGEINNNTKNGLGKYVFENGDVFKG